MAKRPSSLEPVEEKLARVLGGPVGATRGVLHVAAVDAGDDVLRIRPDTPKSELDLFLLETARTRADAIVTTGRILREEPGVTHESRGRASDPYLVVLTSGRDLDPAHPALAARVRPVIFTAADRADALLRALPDRVRVVADDNPDIRRAVAFARDELAAGCVSIEAGPSSALPLYGEPPAVDELWLSRVLAPVAPHLRGGAFLTASKLDALLPLASRAEHDQESGRWRFERRVRQRGGSSIEELR